MSKILVKPMLVFGSALSPSGNIAQFGSLAASAIAYSADPTVIQNLAAWLNGWAAALINAPGGNASPALEDMNALFYVLTYQLAYLKQAGLAEWDATVTYYAGSWAQDGNGVPYVSLTNDNLNNALTDTNNWQPLRSQLVQGQSTCKAWVTFSGASGAILAGFNVSSITKTAVGCYVLNFTAAMADANYAWSGSCGTPNGGVPGPGDNNSLVGGPPGKTVIKTANQLSVFAWESRNQVLEDPSEVTVMIFGN